MCLAIPGRVVQFEDEEQHFATVEVSGVKRTVNVDLLREEGLATDDWVLIHVGFAMSKISEQEAQEQIELLKMMGEADAALEELQGYGSEGDPFGEDSSEAESEESEIPEEWISSVTPSEENVSGNDSVENDGPFD